MSKVIASALIKTRLDLTTFKHLNTDDIYDFINNNDILNVKNYDDENGNKEIVQKHMKKHYETYFNNLDLEKFLNNLKMPIQMVNDITVKPTINKDGLVKFETEYLPKIIIKIYTQKCNDIIYNLIYYESMNDYNVICLLEKYTNEKSYLLWHCDAHSYEYFGTDTMYWYNTNGNGSDCKHLSAKKLECPINIIKNIINAF